MPMGEKAEVLFRALDISKKWVFATRLVAVASSFLLVEHLRFA